MIRLRALLVGAALITGASALASAQPLPQANWSYGDRDHDQNRDRDRDRDSRRYVYNQGYYGRYYARPNYDRDDRRWKDRDDRKDHERDWRFQNRGRDWDHDGDRR